MTRLNDSCFLYAFIFSFVENTLLHLLARILPKNAGQAPTCASTDFFVIFFTEASLPAFNF